MDEDLKSLTKIEAELLFMVIDKITPEDLEKLMDEMELALQEKMIQISDPNSIKEKDLI
jgi:hypothetical protein